SVLEGAQQMSEAGLDFLGVVAEQLKDPLLHVASVDSDASATELPAVTYKVVRLGPGVAGPLLQARQVLIHGRGKRMMGCVPTMLIGVPLEPWKLGNA